MAQFDFPDSPAVNDVYDTGTGVRYKWDGTAWMVDTGLTPMPVNQRVTVYSGAGTYAYVKPAGLKHMEIEIWGAGGGGGGAQATAATTMSAGGGGGAGGYCKKLYAAADLATNEPLVLGAAGVAGTPTVNGGTGGNSTFKGLTAAGGVGASFGTPSASVGGTSGRGVGGVASGGDINTQGGTGQMGIRFAHGSTLSVQPGMGGAAFAQPQWFTPNVTGQSDSGATVTAPGNGGNGSALGLNQATTFNGAAGGAGMAIITEWFWDPDYVAVAPLISSIKRIVMLASGTYTKPAGLKFVDVELVGTGGNGGVAALTAAGQSSAGSGGGGGGYCRKLYEASDLAASEPVVIGAIAGGSGGNGGDSTFKGLVAGGGQGGGTVAAGTTLAQAAAGVAGTATGGDVNIPGGAGESGIRACHGSAPTGQRGPGGNTALSAKTGGVIVASTSLGGPAGNFPGGGGGGAANGQSVATASSGGFGAAGVAIFTEYY